MAPAVHCRAKVSKACISNVLAPTFLVLSSVNVEHVKERKSWLKSNCDTEETTEKKNNKNPLTNKARQHKWKKGVALPSDPVRLLLEE